MWCFSDLNPAGLLKSVIINQDVTVAMETRNIKVTNICTFVSLSAKLPWDSS